MGNPPLLCGVLWPKKGMEEDPGNTEIFSEENTYISMYWKSRKMKRQRQFVVIWIVILLTLMYADIAQAEKTALSSKEVSVAVGKTVKLSVKYANGAEVSWSSSNKKIASVRVKAETAVITGKKAGSCSVTASVNGEEYLCRVTVKKAQKPKKISLNKTSITELQGKSISLKATVTPAGGCGCRHHLVKQQ